MELNGYEEGDDTDDFILLQRFGTLIPTIDTRTITIIKAIADSLGITESRIKETIEDAHYSFRQGLNKI